MMMLDYIGKFVVSASSETHDLFLRLRNSVRLDVGLRRCSSCSVDIWEYKIDCLVSLYFFPVINY